MSVEHIFEDIIIKRIDLNYEFYISKVPWKWEDEYKAYIKIKNREIYFEDAQSILHEEFNNGIGIGTKSKYIYKKNGEIPTDIIFETKVWLEKATKDIIFEWIPVKEDIEILEEVVWPGTMEFKKKSDKWYTVFNEQQGTLIPNTWPTDVEKIILDGHLCSLAAYMPWFGQVKGEAGYIAVCETPWDAKFYINHQFYEYKTSIGIKWLPSMKKIGYKRVMRFKFGDKCDYNSLCKIYRNLVKEQGEFYSLNEKSLKLPNINKLVGGMVVHQCIKKNIDESSLKYNKKQKEHYKIIRTYEELTEDIEEYKRNKIEKLYFHIDGWAEPGYDNQHPDYCEICKEAGGIKKFRDFLLKAHRNGFLCGLHDQYRDYYVSAPTFDENMAILTKDNEVPYSNRWDGGKQTYLCASQALFYLKRNIKKLQEMGIDVDVIYLDAFTCNEPEECYNPEHKMSRRECIEYRRECFEYLMANHILPSSEDVSHWSIKELVIPHFAPYSFMMKSPGVAKDGIPIPLFNLVYHDCLIIPWPMEKLGNEDYMLYALLNGGIPYLVREGAYDNVDCIFDGYEKIEEQENISRCKVVAGLHEKVGKEEMLCHHFIDNDYLKQEVKFSNGIVVKINMHNNTYIICDDVAVK